MKYQKQNRPKQGISNRSSTATMKKGKYLLGLHIIFVAIYLTSTPMIADASPFYHPHAEVKVIGFPTESFAEVDNFMTVILTNEKVWNGEESINEKLGNVVLLELDGGIFTSVELINCDKCFDGYGNIERSELVIDKNFLAEGSSAVAIIRYKATKTSGTISLKVTGRIKDKDNFYGADYSDYNTFTVSGTIISPNPGFSVKTLADLAHQRGEFYNQSANLLSNLQADSSRINNYMNEAWTSSMYWIVGLSAQLVDIQTAEPPTSAKGLFKDGASSYLDPLGRVTDYYLEDTFYNIDQAVENLIMATDYSGETYLLESSLIKMKNANYKEADYWDSKDIGSLRYMFDYNIYSSNIPNEARILEEIHINAGYLKNKANNLISTKGREEDFYALQMAEVIQTFTEKDMAYKNKINEAIKDTSFFNNFEGNINNPPKPLLSEEISSFTLEPGQEKDITVKIQNIGGPTNTTGYFDLSVSNGLDVTYWSSSSNTLLYANIGPNSQNPTGLIWKKGCTQDTAQFELISAYDSFAAGELKTITFRIKAVGSGAQWLKHRISMRYAGGCEDYIRYPTSGGTDQQGWYAIEVPVTISTVKNPPVSPVLSNPGGTISSGSYSIAWSQVAFAANYVLEESTDSFSSSNQIYSGSSTSKSITKITNGVYYYRVKACNLDGCSGWSNIEDINVEINNPPYIPGNPSPSDDASNQPDSLTLSWIGGDPDAGDSVNYTIYLSPSPTTQICSGTSTYCSVSGLSLNTKYYWKVVASDGKAPQNSPVWSFTTALQSTPTTRSVCSSGCDYTSIQVAIDAANSGDTIEVRSGTYPEQVIVNRKLTLRGINNPVVNTGGSGSAITLAADGITLEGFAATGSYEAGIKVTSNNNMLSGNDVSANYGGISLSSSNNNTLSDNDVSNNYDFGIYLSGDNNTLIGNNVSSTIPIYWSSGRGINLWGSNNTLISNDVSNNTYGIFLPSSGKNTLKNNIMNENRYNFGLWESSDSVFDNQIDATNLVDGKPVYYLKGARDIVYDSYTNTGTIYCINCVNITIKNLDLKNNGFGIFFWNTTNSKIQNVNASNNWHGISLYNSNKNELIGNYVSSNCEGHAMDQDYGIFLFSSSNNTLSSNNVLYNCNGIRLESSSDNNKLINNNASSNHGWRPAAGVGVEYSNNNTLSGNNASDNDHGIFLYYSNKNTLRDNNISYNGMVGIDLNGNNNTLTGNNISNNGVYYSGISLSSFNNNLIYNNIFNNTNNIQVYESNINTWNITRQSGTNIISGPYLGGNFWAYPNGTGFSQTCPDVNKDGICDSTYLLDSNNIDYLPLARFTTIGITVVSPNGETWARGTTQTIRWTYSGTPGSNVRIELMKNGVLNRTINSSVPIGSSGNGSYSWSISSTQTPGSDYKVRITSATNSIYNDTSNNNFTILAIPTGYGYIYGKLTNDSVGIAGALVITNTTVSTTTDTSGFYSLLVPAGKYNLTATKEPAYYKNSSVVVTAISGTAIVKDIIVAKKLTGTISGTVQR